MTLTTTARTFRSRALSSSTLPSCPLLFPSQTLIVATGHVTTTSSDTQSLRSIWWWHHKCHKWLDRIDRDSSESTKHDLLRERLCHTLDHRPPHSRHMRSWGWRRSSSWGKPPRWWVEYWDESSKEWDEKSSKATKDEYEPTERWKRHMVWKQRIEEDPYEVLFGRRPPPEDPYGFHSMFIKGAVAKDKETTIETSVKYEYDPITSRMVPKSKVDSTPQQVDTTSESTEGLEPPVQSYRSSRESELEQLSKQSPASNNNGFSHLNESPNLTSQTTTPKSGDATAPPTAYPVKQKLPENDIDLLRPSDVRAKMAISSDVVNDPETPEKLKTRRIELDKDFDTTQIETTDAEDIVKRAETLRKRLQNMEKSLEIQEKPQMSWKTHSPDTPASLKPLESSLARKGFVTPNPPAQGTDGRTPSGKLQTSLDRHNDASMQTTSFQELQTLRIVDGPNSGADSGSGSGATFSPEREENTSSATSDANSKTRITDLLDIRFVIARCEQRLKKIVAVLDVDKAAADTMKALKGAAVKKKLVDEIDALKTAMQRLEDRPRSDFSPPQPTMMDRQDAEDAAAELKRSQDEAMAKVKEQQQRDNDLVKEIRHSYESVYGPITTKHVQGWPLYEENYFSEPPEYQERAREFEEPKSHRCENGSKQGKADVLKANEIQEEHKLKPYGDRTDKQTHSALKNHEKDDKKLYDFKTTKQDSEQYTKYQGPVNTQPEAKSWVLVDLTQPEERPKAELQAKKSPLGSSQTGSELMSTNSIHPPAKIEPEESAKVTRPKKYKVIAYNPSTDQVMHATTFSTPIQRLSAPIPLAVVLTELEQPAKFLQILQSFVSQGFVPVAHAKNHVTLTKLPSDTPACTVEILRLKTERVPEVKRSPLQSWKRGGEEDGDGSRARSGRWNGVLVGMVSAWSTVLFLYVAGVLLEANSTRDEKNEQTKEQSRRERRLTQA